MSLKSINFKLEERRINNIKTASLVFNTTMTDIVNNAIDRYIEELSKDPLYRLTANVQEVDNKERKEILKEIESLSDDDLSISSIRKFKV